MIDDLQTRIAQITRHKDCTTDECNDAEDTQFICRASRFAAPLLDALVTEIIVKGRYGGERDNGRELLTIAREGIVRVADKLTDFATCDKEYPPKCDEAGLHETFEELETELRGVLAAMSEPVAKVEA